MGEKLLRWEKEGIMQASLEKNRWMLNFYKEQIKSDEEKLKEKNAKTLIRVNRYRKTEKGKKKREEYRKSHNGKLEGILG